MESATDLSIQNGTTYLNEPMKPKVSQKNSKEHPEEGSSLRRKLHQTLFGQIALSLVLIFAVLGSMQFLALRATLNRADDLLLQIQMWDIAREFSNTIISEEEKNKDQWEIENAVRTLAKVNPLIDAYLLRQNGEVEYSFSENYGSPQQKIIRIEPIREFLLPDASQRAPLYGEDPDGKKNDLALFSAAAFVYHGEPHYLYAVLRGHRHLQAYKLYSENLLAKNFSISTVIAFLVIVGFGTTIFYVLSRRVTRTVQTMRAFRDGSFESRVKATGSDEIAELGQTFDEMAEQIVKSIDDLKERDSLRRELIASVSHDLRGPVANILAHVERSEGEGETQEVVKRNALQLSRLLSELFELAKLEAREVEPQIEPHFLLPLYEDLLISYRSKADELGISLGIEGCENDIEVDADMTMLGRVLGNLIENALRFTHAGGRITLGAVKDGEKVRISVKDSGEGIAESELPKIFNKFFKLF